MRTGRKQVLAASVMLSAGVLGLTGCGVVNDTVEGLTGQGSTNLPQSPASPPPGELEDLSVVITVSSDAETSGKLSVEIDASDGGQSLREDSVPLPFEQEFSVAADKPLPLRKTQVEAEAGPGATYIECSIAVDGTVVASHRAEGSAATVTCERGLRLGPS